MKVYELRFEVPLPAGDFAEAEMMMRLKAPVEACLKAWDGVKAPGFKLGNSVIEKRGEHGTRKPKIMQQLWVGRSSAGAWSWFITLEEAAASGAMDVTEASREECEIAQKIMQADRAGAMPPASLGRRMKQLLAKRVVPPEPVVTAPSLSANQQAVLRALTEPVVTAPPLGPLAFVAGHLARAEDAGMAANTSDEMQPQADYAPWPNTGMKGMAQ